MPVDPNRSTFVQQEYRYEIAENLTVKATYPSARELVHNTNLSASAADALASAMFNECSAPAQAFRVQVEEVYRLEEIENGPLRFTLDIPKYQTDNRAYKVTKFEVDWLKNRTTFEVRG